MGVMTGHTKGAGGSGGQPSGCMALAVGSWHSLLAGQWSPGVAVERAGGLLDYGKTGFSDSAGLTQVRLGIGCRQS